MTQKEYTDALRERSGHVMFPSKLTAFLYQLIRDHVVPGQAELYAQRVQEARASEHWCAFQDNVTACKWAKRLYPEDDGSLALFIHFMLADRVSSVILLNLVEENEKITDVVLYTNGWLASYAEDLCRRLMGTINPRS